MIETEQKSISSGIEKLDEILGGGYRPGSLVVVKGATGIGKTRLMVQSALSQSDDPIFCDFTRTGNPQPIALFAERYHGRRIMDWNVGQTHYVERMRLGVVNSGSEIADCILKEHATIKLRDGAENISHHTHTEEFLRFQLNRGARLLAADGFVPSSMGFMHAEQVEDFYELFKKLKTGELYSRDLPYDPKKLTFLAGETSGLTYMDDLFRYFNVDSPFCSQAETVILYGYKRQDGKDIRVLRVAKHRQMPVEPRDFRVVENGKKLDIQELTN